MLAGEIGEMMGGGTEGEKNGRTNKKIKKSVFYYPSRHDDGHRPKKLLRGTREEGMNGPFEAQRII